MKCCLNVFSDLQKLGLSCLFFFFSYLPFRQRNKIILTCFLVSTLIYFIVLFCTPSPQPYTPDEFFHCRQSGPQSKPIFDARYDPHVFDLSIIMASRNDFYGGSSSVSKLQLGLDLFASQLAKYSNETKIEIILIEWNPDPSMPLLKTEIRFPSNIASFRIINVPSYIHQCWTQHTTMPPIAEFLAKNIGIRRARGKYILPKAQDTIFSVDWWKFFAHGEHIKIQEQYKEPLLFRMMRIDLGTPFPLLRFSTDNLESLLEESDSNNLTQMNGALNQLFKKNDVSLYNSEIEFLKKQDQSLIWSYASGDFLLMSRDNWYKVRAFTEVPTYMHWDTVILLHARAMGMRYYNLLPPIAIYHPFHERSKAQGSWTETNWKWYNYFFELPNPNDDYWGHPFHEFQEEEWVYGQKLITEP